MIKKLFFNSNKGNIQCRNKTIFEHFFYILYAEVLNRNEIFMQELSKKNLTQI